MNDRRRVLKSMAGVIAVLAGCAGGDDSTPDGSATGSSGGSGTTDTESGGGGSGTESGTPDPADEGTPTRACIPLGPEVDLSFLRGGGQGDRGGGQGDHGEGQGISDRTLSLSAGETTTVTLVIVNAHGLETDLDATLDTPWSATQVGFPVRPVETDVQFNHAVAEWEVTVPASAADEHAMTASVTSTYQCSVGQMEYATSFEQPIEISPVMSAPFGLNAGGWHENDDDAWVWIDGLWFDNGTEDEEGGPYVTVHGDASASPTDTAVGHVRSDAEIVSTEHYFLYRTAHVGGNLGYDVAIENGTYDVRLYFAENDEEVGPGDRVFDVSIQGSVRLEAFDVADQNEFIHAPVVRTFEGVEVTDGTLSITTESIEGNSMVNGFSIREAGDGGSATSS